MGGKGDVHDGEFQGVERGTLSWYYLSYYMVSHPNAESVTTWLLDWGLQHKGLRDKDFFWL